MVMLGKCCMHELLTRIIEKKYIEHLVRRNAKVGLENKLMPMRSSSLCLNTKISEII